MYIQRDFSQQFRCCMQLLSYQASNVYSYTNKPSSQITPTFPFCPIDKGRDFSDCLYTIWLDGQSSPLK